MSFLSFPPLFWSNWWNTTEMFNKNVVNTCQCERQWPHCGPDGHSGLPCVLPFLMDSRRVVDFSVCSRFYLLGGRGNFFTCRTLECNWCTKEAVHQSRIWFDEFGHMYGKSPTYEPSSCELSNMRTCIQAWVKLQLALRPLLLTILQLYHLPPPLPPPVSNSSCLFTRCQPLDASCCTGLLYSSRDCNARLKMFSLFLCVCFYVQCIICVKSIINLL